MNRCALSHLAFSDNSLRDKPNRRISSEAQSLCPIPSWSQGASIFGVLVCPSWDTLSLFLLGTDLGISCTLSTDLSTQHTSELYSYRTDWVSSSDLRNCREGHSIVVYKMYL